MIKSVQRGFELNGTHQLLLCADDANILGRSTHTMKKNMEALVVASKETDPEVHAEKTKYMDMSSDQDTSQNQNSIQEEKISRVKLGNACYHLVRNLQSFSLLSKNIKLKIHRTVILPIVLYGCETWLLTLKEEHRISVFVNRVLRRTFGPKREKVTGEVENTYCIMRSLMISAPHQILFG